MVVVVAIKRLRIHKFNFIKNLDDVEVFLCLKQAFGGMSSIISSMDHCPECARS